MAASPLRTTITPGSGSITDVMGNVHTITAAGVAQANAINAKTHQGVIVGGPSATSAAITNGYFLATGEMYVKDAMGRWYHWESAKGAYVQPGPPPGGMT